MNHNAMQRIGDWALELETISFTDRTAFYYEVFCRLAKLIQVKSASLQRFQLAFKHLLLLEKNSRLHPIFQDFAFNFHTFSRSGKVVRKFPDFFKNSRLCTNPDLSIHFLCHKMMRSANYPCRQLNSEKRKGATLCYLSPLIVNKCSIVSAKCVCNVNDGLQKAWDEVCKTRDACDKALQGLSVFTVDFLKARDITILEYVCNKKLSFCLFFYRC